MANAVEIPGFVYDPVKRRYFKKTKDSVLISKVERAENEKSLEKRYAHFSRLCVQNRLQAVNALRLSNEQEELGKFIYVLNVEFEVAFLFKFNIKEKFGHCVEFQFITNYYADGNQGYLFVERNTGKIWQMRKDFEFNSWLITMVNKMSELKDYESIESSVITRPDAGQHSDGVFFKSASNDFYNISAENGILQKINIEEQECSFFVKDYDLLFLKLPNNSLKVYHYKSQGKPFVKFKQTLAMSKQSDVVSLLVHDESLFVCMRNGTIKGYKKEGLASNFAKKCYCSWNINDHIQILQKKLAIFKIAAVSSAKRFLIFTNMGVLFVSHSSLQHFSGGCFFKDALSETLNSTPILHGKQVLHCMLKYENHTLLIYGKMKTPLKHFQVYKVDTDDDDFDSDSNFFQKPITDFHSFIQQNTNSQVDLDELLVINFFCVETEITFFLFSDNHMHCLRLQLLNDCHVSIV